MIEPHMHVYLYTELMPWGAWFFVSYMDAAGEVVFQDHIEPIEDEL